MSVPLHLQCRIQALTSTSHEGHSEVREVHRKAMSLRKEKEELP